VDDKLIVSHRAALKAKYGAAGLAQIRTAVRALIAADRQRGMRSRLVFLDDARTLKQLGGTPATLASSPAQAKAAIDAVFRALDPAYLMILGAPDVVPHQDVANPMHAPPADPDPIAWSDLPYACEAGYGREASAFKGPTRVVARLPDLTGATEPSHLIGLLEAAAAHTTRDVAEFGDYFGLSTATWRASTALSLFNVFGHAKAMSVSPPAREAIPPTRLAPLMHFINCHGGLADPRFYGEDAAGHQPVSMSSTGIAGRIRRGTVAAAECCYGGELYDSVTLGLPLPIGQHYLAQGACGFFGSSTIAYGPVEGNGSADLLTQYFLLAVLEGASIGRATLMARQRFVQQTSELDPTDLKTLAQFSLLGDPSLHPARVPAATGVPQGLAPLEAQRLQRRERRAALRSAGEFLDATKPATAQPQPSAKASAAVRRALAHIAERAGLPADQVFVAYAVDSPAGAPLRPTRGKATPSPTRYHLAVSTPEGATRPSGTAPSAVAALAREVGGRIVGYRVYVQR
jgi:hypothetical protein